jgi:hypothetical protein
MQFTRPSPFQVLIPYASGGTLESEFEQALQVISVQLVGGLYFEKNNSLCLT